MVPIYTFYLFFMVLKADMVRLVTAERPTGKPEKGARATAINKFRSPAPPQPPAPESEPIQRAAASHASERMADECSSQPKETEEPQVLQRSRKYAQNTREGPGPLAAEREHR